MTQCSAKNNNDDIDIIVQLDTLSEAVRLCIKKCRKFTKIPGIAKLERKFRAEDRYLERVCIYGFNFHFTLIFVIA